MIEELVFMVNYMMRRSIHIDKSSGSSLLMVKIGVEAYLKEIERKECLPMDFTRRP